MGKNGTVLESEKGREPLRSNIRTAPTTPLEKIRTIAKELSKPDFRITAYETNRGGKKRIQVEIRGTRTKVKNSWKKTKLCDTDIEAIDFVHRMKK